MAGLGFAFGTTNEVQGSLVVDKEIDPSNNPVSLQRAEILAAIEGLLAMSCWEAKHEKKARRSKGRGGNVDNKNWVIGTDSSYLVKAMTKAFPQWKVSPAVLRHWNVLTIFSQQGKHGKDAEAVEPAHLDLLQTLHTTIVAEELKQRVKIGFWKIAKEHNIAAITNANNASMKAANERYTEAEKAELAEQRRTKSTKKILEAHTSTMTTSENDLSPLEEMPVNTQVEKDTVSKPANVDVGQEAGRTKTKATLAGTEPVSLAADSEGTLVLIDAKGSRGTLVEAPAPNLVILQVIDIACCILCVLFIGPGLRRLDDKLYELPWAPKKQVLGESALRMAL